MFGHRGAFDNPLVDRAARNRRPVNNLAKFTYPATLRRCTVGHNAVGAGADVPEHHSNRLTFHCGRRIAQDAPADGATGPDADASPAP